MTVGCLWIPRFPLACELAERPALAGRPIAVALPDRPGVWTASVEAEREGVRPGQALREALGRCPALAVVAGRPVQYERQWDAVLVACEQITGGVDPGPPGEAYVDLGGLRRRPVGQIHAALLACAPARLRPRLGVGPNPFVALLAARAAPASTARTVTPAEAAAFLTVQPIDALPLSDEVRRRLRLLGLDTLGALAALPITALIAQFGPEGGQAWRLARGEDDRPLRPRPFEARIVERQEFAEPLVSRPALLIAAEHLITGVLRQPALRGRLARQLVVQAITDGGDHWQRTLTCKPPTADRDLLQRLAAAALEQARLSGPVIELEVELRGLASPQGWQGELLPARQVRQERLEDCLRQLKARYGHCPVSRVVEVEPWSRIPERRLALADYDP